MRILFVHHGNQPRLRQLAAWFARDPGNEVVLAGRRGTTAPEGVRTATFSTTRPGGEHCHRYLRDAERAVLVGQGVARLGAELHLGGFRPDVVYGEGGSGACLYVRETFTAAALVVAFGAYLRPDQAPPPRRPPAEADAACHLRARNGPNLADLAHCDHGVVASAWALDTFPAFARPVLSLLVDGVDDRFFTPDAGGRGREVVTVACSRLAGGEGVDAVAPVLVELQRRPGCQVVVVGGDLRRGGPQPAVGRWARCGVDVTRLRVVGPLAPSARRDLLQGTSAYVHLGPAEETAGPLEAMSSGCLVVVPDGGPTAELVEHGRSGLLFPVAELATGPEALGALVAAALGDGGLVARAGAAARRAVLERHRLADALGGHARLVQDVAGGRRGAEVEGSVLAAPRPPAAAAAPDGPPGRGGATSAAAPTAGAR